SPPIHLPLRIARLYGPSVSSGVRHNRLQRGIARVAAKEILVECAQVPLSFSRDGAECGAGCRRVDAQTNSRKERDNVGQVARQSGDAGTNAGKELYHGSDSPTAPFSFEDDEIEDRDIVETSSIRPRDVIRHFHSEQIRTPPSAKGYDGLEDKCISAA